MMAQDNTMQSVLVVDDEQSIRFVLTKGLQRKNFVVDTASTLAQAGELINENAYSIVFLDIIMPDGSGLDFLRVINKRSTPPCVVVMTAEATMKNAVQAMQKGAFDYITKPFDFDVIDVIVNRAVEHRRMSSELAELKSRCAPASASVPGELVGRSEAMREVFKLIGKAANSGANVLITGPTGSGKELVARALHYNSGRAGGPFVTVNCAAIPAGLLESELFGHIKGAFTGAVETRRGKFLAASGGAILLDEIGDMPLPLQAKMLRVLQDGEFYPVGATKPERADARILASTNRDLASSAEDKNFRADLYHRLNVIHIQMPTLKERKTDIPPLATHFLEKIARAFNEEPKIISPDVMEILMNYDWPGNVRELENATRRAVIMAHGQAITVEDLPAELGGKAGVNDSTGELARAIRRIAHTAPEGAVYEKVIERVEKALIGWAMERSGHVQTKAARTLGLNRNTLAKKITELNIKPENE